MADERVMMVELDYTIKSDRSFDEAVDAVVAAAPEYGFGVQHVHDLQAALAKQGLQREPLKLIGLCNARHAHAVLNRDIRVALMLPCPVAVYEQDGEVYVSTMHASMMSEMFPEAHIDDVAAEVEDALVAMVDAGG
ncbi:MAG: DUF302 domain-containing protein [candidate division WS1 bacterium]|nr:DUF302 domain-containing protein [candidate division WS1 bacterium]